MQFSYEKKLMADKIPVLGFIFGVIVLMIVAVIIRDTLTLMVSVILLGEGLIAVLVLGLKEDIHALSAEVEESEITP